MQQIVLASTSIYRKQLLMRLGLDFECQAPNVDEDLYKNKGLNPVELAETLAKAKAESLRISNSVVIGGDQVVTLDGQIFGKAKSLQKACEQLSMLQDRTHEIITSVCVYKDDQSTIITDRTKMTMRKLSDQEILNYVRLDNPLDTAGSYKIEQHGISLFAKIESHDWTAIQGIPLLALHQCLINKGYIR